MLVKVNLMLLDVGGSELDVGGWAVRLQIGSRLAPLQAWPVCFPFYHSLCEATVSRFATLGKVKGEGVALRFPFGFWFSCPRLVFLVSSHQLLGSLTGRPGAGGSISSYFLWEGYTDVQDMFWGKVLFRSLYFQIEVSVMFCDDPRRLPSICLGRGCYEFTST